jgi:hypothetical protein
MTMHHCHGTCWGSYDAVVVTRLPFCRRSDPKYAVALQITKKLFQLDGHDYSIT